MRLMAGQWLNGRVEHSLDWFHLRRRIEWLSRSIHWVVDYGDHDGMEKSTRNRRNLRSVRWNLWQTSSPAASSSLRSERSCAPKWDSAIIQRAWRVPP
jgi:hypothetical protein